MNYGMPAAWTIVVGHWFEIGWTAIYFFHLDKEHRPIVDVPGLLCANPLIIATGNDLGHLHWSRDRPTRPAIKKQFSAAL